MLNFVHIGIGQCGNRLAEQFGKSGRLAFAINTARVDMLNLDSKAIAPKNQIHIALEGNKDGAGRNPVIGKESMEANIDKVYEAIVRATKDMAVDRFRHLYSRDAHIFFKVFSFMNKLLFPNKYMVMYLLI